VVPAAPVNATFPADVIVMSPEVVDVIAIAPDVAPKVRPADPAFTVVWEAPFVLPILITLFPVPVPDVAILTVSVFALAVCAFPIEIVLVSVDWPSVIVPVVLLSPIVYVDPATPVAAKFPVPTVKVIPVAPVVFPKVSV